MFVTVLKCYLHLMIAIYDIYYGRLKTDLQQDLQQAYGRLTAIVLGLLEIYTKIPYSASPFCLRHAA